MTTLLATLVLIYAGWCALLYIFQTSLVFPRGLARHFMLDSVPGGVEQVWIEADDGSRVEGWYIPPEADPDEPDRARPLAVFFHGNGEVIDNCLPMAALYRSMGFAVLLPEYRGYGRSEGTPSQRAILDDSERFVELITERPEVDADRVVYHGRSIGGAVAVLLSQRRRPRAIVTESVMTSVAGFAVRFGAPPLLVRHPFRVDRALPGYDGPVLLFHGEDDEIVPVSHARRLHGLAPGSTLAILGGGHNDFPADTREYERVLRGFLSESGLLDASTGGAGGD